jgi:hypothetical protein
MENNKYYTPSIEEFHVGFEFESDFWYFTEGGEWAQSKITEENFHDFHTLYKSDAYETEFRVKCFDQEDVKSVIKINYTDKNGQLVHIGEHTELMFLYDGEKLKITEEITGYFSQVLFDAPIKNISELRRELKRLEIIKL